jgi:hypothetical protein
MNDNGELTWEFSTRGTFDQIARFAAAARTDASGDARESRREGAPDWPITGLGTPYDATDLSPFNPSGAIYFMDGYSDAKIRLRASGEEILLQFWDKNTSISASAPFVFDEERARQGVYLPAPPPLRPIAHAPLDAPGRYMRSTSAHLMQVISMNMKHQDGASRLLIGLPYAEAYPRIFYDGSHFPEGREDGSSYGMVQSLTEFTDPATGTRETDANGYPARSFFAIYHIIETPVGAFFNKKATQMELQPNGNGKLALRLPPIPFNYALINAPIPLYDVADPSGEPVAELVDAHHHDAGAANMATEDAWPYHQPDVAGIERSVAKLSRRRGGNA